MTYATKDASVEDSRPVELYRFETPLVTYYRTNREQDIDVAGTVYLASNIERKTLETSTITTSTRSLDIEIPVDDPLAVSLITSVAVDYLSVTIDRYHEGDDPSTEYERIYVGKMEDMEAAGETLTVSFTQNSVPFVNGETRGIYYQSNCNHRLFGPRCGLSEADYRVTTTVVMFSDLGVTVDDDGFADFGLVAGKITNTRTGEGRMIINNVANAIAIHLPFSDLVVGDTVTLTRGCMHDFASCLAFANTINYGGFPTIPVDEPVY